MASNLGAQGTRSHDLKRPLWSRCVLSIVTVVVLCSQNLHKPTPQDESAEFTLTLLCLPWVVEVLRTLAGKVP